ncbi:helix-turn-helix transcriptional regulator [Paractinoplanes rhizophilus]|jgi:predicted DNA-binding transcriptional regulator AlpA|uniref:Helix-turn-helix transcriptional regulator n=1 Tax=Paractinoplanes rhizophilus TaxID=1416877 RepID=A0ABW2HPB8_9ACTN|nr:AlpA family phage regulatory protein [Actinoplanes sp.]
MTSPPSRLVGAHEIRLRLGLSRQRVQQLTHFSTFPKPIAELEQGKVWRSEDIEAWILAHRPKDRRAADKAG